MYRDRQRHKAMRTERADKDWMEIDTERQRHTLTYKGTHRDDGVLTLVEK